MEKISPSIFINNLIHHFLSYSTQEVITKEMYYDRKKYYDKRGLGPNDINPNFGKYHPHLHILLAVEHEYFKKNSPLYITQKEWVSLWRRALEVDYNPIVDVRVIYEKDFDVEGQNSKDGPNSQNIRDTDMNIQNIQNIRDTDMNSQSNRDTDMNTHNSQGIQIGPDIDMNSKNSQNSHNANMNSQGNRDIPNNPNAKPKAKTPHKASIAGAILESSKYTTKSNDYLIRDKFGAIDTQKTDKAIWTLYGSLAGRRLNSMGGVFRQAHKFLHLDDVDNGNLVHIEAEKNEKGEDIITYECRWARGGYSAKPLTIPGMPLVSLPWELEAGN